ncbi:MAG: hypothetical protein K5773_09350 [Pseudobutyrivibrio sp.]|nr:hypothetical protein [Pseudobutyrivibrio sp.]
MENLEIALCDLDSDYITRFGSYMMEKAPAVNIHIFTKMETYFSSQINFSVEIMTEEFEEMASFRGGEAVGHRYILSEQKEEGPNLIYKYQSMDRIFGQIKEIGPAPIKRKTSTSDSKVRSKIIGVYSPISHELQLPFAMALGHSHTDQGRVLFLDLEEVSILPDLIGGKGDRNLMDLLYEINTNAEVNIENYVRSFMGFDFVEPFINPNEIGEVDEETWDKFFKFLGDSDYQVIVALFGTAINGFTKYISELDHLYVLGKPGDYFKKGQSVFESYLIKAGIETEYEFINLPMSAANLSEGTYLLEELLQGKLGSFVRQAVKGNG